MTETLAPRSEEEVCGLVREAAARRRGLRIVGGNTRAGFGRPVDAEAALSASALSGILFHEPAELIISARAGTPVAEVEAALAEKGQMLPFEPVDLRRLLGTSGEPTLGGLVAGNWSGPRRISAGSVRDHVTGVRFVNGAGEAIKSGGRVMKNVTGLDLAKLMCGAQGTYGVLTEVTLKVLPRPRRAATMVFSGLDEGQAVQALCAALGSPHGVSGAAHRPAGLGSAMSKTLLRVEGFPSSVDHRIAELAVLLARYGTPETMEGAGTEALWRDLRDGAPLAEPREEAVWRLSVAPTRGPSLAGLIGGARPGRCTFDWGGGLLWLSTPATEDAGAADIRKALTVTGGQATLVRAPEAVRRRIDVFQPLAAPLAAVAGRLKASFDPQNVLNPGRLVAAA